MFPFASFYAFSGFGTKIYEKAHHGLSLSSFTSFSSRQERRANLVSFMLVKYLNDRPVSIGLTFSNLMGLPTVKKSLIPYRMGELSYVYFYPFLGIGYYQWKRSPTRVFFVLLDSLKLKAPLSIYFLGLAKNPWDCTITVSLDTTPQ